MHVLKLALGIAAVLFGVLAFGGGVLFGLSTGQEAGLSGACAGGCALL